MNAFQIHVRVKLVMDTNRQAFPLWNLWIRLALLDSVSINWPTILAWVGKEAIRIHRFLVGRRGCQAKKNSPTRAEMVENTIPVAEVGPVALVQNHQPEVVSIVTQVFVAEPPSAES